MLGGCKGWHEKRKLAAPRDGLVPNYLACRCFLENCSAAGRSVGRRCDDLLQPYWPPFTASAIAGCMIPSELARGLIGSGSIPCRACFSSATGCRIHSPRFARLDLSEPYSRKAGGLLAHGVECQVRCADGFDANSGSYFCTNGELYAPTLTCSCTIPQLLPAWGGGARVPPPPPHTHAHAHAHAHHITHAAYPACMHRHT